MEPKRLTRPETGLRQLLAPNPSPMTYSGTNTFLLGEGDVVVIDPGPSDPEHLIAIKASLEPGEQIEKILITHSHLDHSALAKELSSTFGAPILAFGNSFSGRSDIMNDLHDKIDLGGGEGVDHDFEPDELLQDGQIVDTKAGTIEAIWTPGHLGNHMCFAWNGALFTGDHIMGWASSIVSPPDGDLSAFMASTTKLKQRKDRIYYPGHGGAISTPLERVDWLLDHRKSREEQILGELGPTPASIREIAANIYTDAPKGMLRAAERNVLAHLIDLYSRGLVAADPLPHAHAKFRRI